MCREEVTEVRPWLVNVVGRVGIQLWGKGVLVVGCFECMCGGGSGCYGDLYVCGRGRGDYSPLLSDARFLGFQRLGECGDGIENRSGERGVSEEGAGGRHVIFAPLKVASWF